MVLLSDGRKLTGVDPLLAAAKAKSEHVVVDTVGVGTNQGGANNQQFGNSPYGYFGRGSEFDPQTLKAIASETGGQYVFVDSASKLNGVYRRLGRSVAWSWHKEEASGLVALVAAGLLVLSLFVGQVRRHVL
ncbi:MAG: VWA domain-containing protein [Deinococcales bacterium]